MDFELRSEIEKKENKNEIDWTLLSYYKTFAIISDILVSENKLHISSEEAIRKIREVMNNNL